MACATRPPIILITGPMAAGKSSVAERIAERFERSVHLRGDVFRRMVVRGRVDMSVRPSDEALRQLRLRYRAAHETARLYHEAGFTVVYQDTIVGPVLDEVLQMYRDLPIHVVVLCPSETAIARREHERRKRGYGRMTIRQLLAALQETPRVGLWIDNSDQTLAQTVDDIMSRLPHARFQPAT